MIESQLLQQFKGYINGQWADAVSGKTFAVYNPATGERLADVPQMTGEETKAAIESGVSAMKTTPLLDQRQAWLNAIADVLLENKQELGRIIILEQGKPLKEGSGEVEYAAGFYRFCAAQIHRLSSEALDENIRNCHWTMHHRPAGVAALLTPWNFPLAMLAKKLSAALAAGCASVTRPASMTPLTAIAFWSLLDRLEMPQGMVNLVMGKSGPISERLCSHPDVRVISFTGSTEVGKLLIRNTADYVKKLTMELGGNAPFIVFSDADLEAAADALIANKFRAAGQTCVCANRVYAHREIIDKFVELVAERTRKLKAGNGMDPDTDIGPLINRSAFDKVAGHVKDAMDKGAVRIVGADPPPPQHDWGAFYPPTVLTAVTREMLVCNEETFGPVIAISEFENEYKVVEESNNTPYGLAAYLFTQDQGRAERVIAALRFGHVGLNTGTGPTPQVPFGGMKQSGFGREGGIDGMLEFCETQAVTKLLL